MLAQLARKGDRMGNMTTPATAPLSFSPTPPVRPFTSQPWQDASPFGDSFFAFLPYAKCLIPCSRNIRVAQSRPLIG